MTQLEWYLQAIGRELQKMIDNNFSGNINFQINLKEGEIWNMNVGLGKSLKMPTEAKII